ncbi:hypothetical protein [Robertmurraya kyonggiensis]|uniref:Uncharacterized protein n=1 Tax=Robertmurraya kyonggiensis TaxID=1037680 RepID=A0A4U1D0D4_9BACI|nr:hypothetical protein [Robertmurraya kyonggiensis]TKC15672.1 hypothetical protein FA727_16225 [Robertmurraya kyonggiensis]
MAKNFFEKNDFKGITTLSLYSIVAIQDENFEKKNSIIFFTASGMIQAEEMLPNKIEERTTDLETSDKLIRSALKNRDKMLREHDNEKLLEENTSFILKNVKIKSLDGNTTNVPIMILFSDSIVGITLGNLD